MSNIAAVVLAAGYSSRMGEFKPLLPLGENTALARAVHLFQAAGITRLLVVTGHRAADLRPVLEKLEVPGVHNPDYHLGMFSSIRAGVAGLPPRTEAFFLLPVDHALVRVQTVKSLLRRRRKSGADIIYPCFAGERGHPPLISAKYTGEILSAPAGGNLRQILARHEAESLDVEVADRGVVLDMDTPKDYQNLLHRAENIDIPDPRECEAILRIAGTPDRAAAHGRAVAELAVALGAELNRRGYQLRLDLIEAAGRLHDMCKGRPRHAAVGAELLAAMGFPRVAEIVACHMGEGLPAGTRIGAKHLVYLADKLLCGDRPVTLEERFWGSMERFAAEPDVKQAIQERWLRAELLKGQLERVLGVQLDTWLKGWRRGV